MRRAGVALLVAISAASVWASDVQAQCAGTSCVVTTNADTLAGAGTSLRDAITYANAHPGTAVTFSNTIANQTITLTSQLPVVFGNNTTIDGGANNITLSGANTYRGLFIGDAGQTANGATHATIENLTITQTKALGGAGASPGYTGGGGGAGMGGAIFVSSTATVTIANLALTSNQAVGGAGGSSQSYGGSGGGGGMGGNGNFGGGGFGTGATGGSPASETAPGSPGLLPGAASGGAGTGSGGPGTGGNGGANGGGGGSGAEAGGGGGVGGGNASGGGQPGVTGVGGNGGFGGGGGAGGLAAGSGGYGGGGGGGGGGGHGGFGGGGGGGNGIGGFGGGNAGGGFGLGGGGGSGLGGAIFVQAGGSLSVTGAITADGSNAATGGAGGSVYFYPNPAGAGSNGAGLGSAIFYQGSVGSTATMNFGAGSQTIGGTIADYIGAGGTNPSGGTNAADQGGRLALAKNGGGTLTLSNANTYSGGTALNSGTLVVGNDHALGSGDLAMAAGTTLSFSGSRTIANNIGLTGDPTFTVNSGTTSTISGVISDTSPGPNAGVLEKEGAGTLVLSGTNTYSGGTTINSGTLALSGTGSIAQSSVADNATFDISATNSGASITSLSGSGTVTLGSKTLTLSNAGDTFSGSINGSGGLTLSSGAETLSGVNGYLGATTINGGTLTLASTGSTTSNVTNAATFTNNGAVTGTVSNSATFNNNTGSIVSGLLTNTAGTTTNAGQLNSGASVSGGTLTNNNLIVGAVTVSATGDVENFLTITGTVSNAATFNNKAAGTVSGLLTNTAGTTTNAGQLNGGAAVSGGTLTTTGTITSGLTNTATVNANGGAINGAIANNAGSFNVGGTVTSNATFANATAATLAVNSAGTYTLQGLLTNSGAITVANGGKLIATVGGITNNSGATITVVAGGTVTDALDNSGVVDNSGAYNADVSNLATGVVTNHSGGTWTGNLLSNVNTVTNQAGATWIGNAFNSVGGMLGNSGTWTGTVSNAGTFSNFAGATVSGLVTNSGSATNAGTLNGGLTNTAGIIRNTGAINGSTLVSGGALTGTGSVAALNVTSGGMLAPGDGSPGASMTAGSLAMQSGAIYLVQLNPTTASFASVTGSATLNGATVNAVFAGGSYVSKQYTILTAGNVSGAFASATVDTNLPSNLHTSLSYDSTHAYLNLLLNFSIPTGLKGNQQGVGDALTNFFNTTGGIPMVYSTLSSAALSQVAGETGTGSQQTTFSAMTQFMGVMTDPFVAGRGAGVSAGGSPNAYAEDSLAYTAKRNPRDALAAIYRKAPPQEPSFDRRWSVWASGFGGTQTTYGNVAVGSNDTRSSLYGTAVGADYLVSPDTLAGFALAGGGTNFSVSGFGGGRSDLFQAGTFIRHNIGAAYLSGALAYGWQDITTDRTVTVAGVDRLRAEFNANAWSGRVEAGYRFVARGIALTPYAAGQFTTFELPDYVEGVVSGAGNFALAYGAKSVTASRSELGLRSDKSFAMQDAVLTLRGRAGWAHDFNNDRSVLATFQALPGASFVVNGAGQASDAALTTAAAEMKWLNGWSAAATFEGEFSEVTRSYAGKGVVRYAW